MSSVPKIKQFTHKSFNPGKSKNNSACPNNHQKERTHSSHSDNLAFSVIPNSSMFGSTGRTNNRNIHPSGQNPMTYFQRILKKNREQDKTKPRKKTELHLSTERSLKYLYNQKSSEHSSHLRLKQTKELQAGGGTGLSCPDVHKKKQKRLNRFKVNRCQFNRTGMSHCVQVPKAA